MKSKGLNSSELDGFKCFLIKVQPSILRVGAIKRKDWPNYLYLLITLSRNQGEAFNLCRPIEHSNGILHTHPIYILTTGSNAPLCLLITKTKLCQPCLSHVRVHLTITWRKSMSSSSAPLLHPRLLTLSSLPSLLPSTLSPLVKVANELWIPLIHILSEVLHLSSSTSLQRLALLSLRVKASKSRQTKVTLLLCFLPAGI